MKKKKKVLYAPEKKEQQFFDFNYGNSQNILRKQTVWYI